MTPKVGQLLRWIDRDLLNVLDNDDVGIVKEVRVLPDSSESEIAVIVDWCKGPHDSFHEYSEYLDSITNGEIVVVE